MTERSRRIVETAVRLAEEGGFEAVRLRDVAARSGVALGTLYTRFRSKEDILIAALEQEVDKLVRLTRVYPSEGSTQLERVLHFFSVASRALFMRPNLSRAIMRSVVAGEPELSERVMRFHKVVTRMIAEALRGRDPSDVMAGPLAEPTEDEERVGFLLQQIWFASLVGWMGGLHDEEAVFDQMSRAASWVLRGHEAELAEG